MTSQGHSQRMWITGCLCVPAHPACQLRLQCPPARQPEDTNKDKRLLYKASILGYCILYSTAPVPTTAFSIDPNCPPCRSWGRRARPLPILLPTTDLLISSLNLQFSVCASG